jgi:PAS domain-containing protein
LDYRGVSSLEKLKDKKYTELFHHHKDYLKIFKREIEKLYDDGYTSLTEEKIIRTKYCKIFDLETIIKKLPYEGDSDKFLVVTRNISDRKKVESLEKAMLEKSKLLD